MMLELQPQLAAIVELRVCPTPGPAGPGRATPRRSSRLRSACRRLVVPQNSNSNTATATAIRDAFFSPPAYVRTGSILPFLHSLPFLRAGETELQYKYGKLGRDLRKFDAEYFKIMDRLADAMDPMGRLLLEKTYEAIVDAGEYARYATACRDTPRCRLESARPDNYTRTYSRISSRLFSLLSAEFEFSQLSTTA